VKKFLLFLVFIPACYAQSLDPTFDTDGKVSTPIVPESSSIYDIALQSDGKIVAVGYALAGVNYDLAIARYNSDGSLDLSFNSIGYDLINFGYNDDVAYAVAIQSNGKIVVAGKASNASNDDFVLLRYNTDGTLDLTFDTDGIVYTTFGTSYEMAYDVAIQADGKIIAAGAGFPDTTYHFAMARYKTDGSLDASFGTGGKVTTLLNNSAEAKSICIQADGKIVLAGKTLQPDFSNAFAVARYNTNGSLDTSFSSDGKVTSDISTYSNEGLDAAIQSDGKIVVVGSATLTGPIQSALVRYNTNGTLDNSFDSDGIVTTAFGTNWDEARSVVIQGDGKILTGGLASLPTAKFAVARYNTDGSLDNTFDTDGKLTTAFGSIGSFWSIVLQPDGKILGGGYSGSGTDYDYAMIRYRNGIAGIDNFGMEEHSLSVYPNPATQQFNIEYTLLNEERITLQLIGLDGKVITDFITDQTQEMGSYHHQLTLPQGLPNGTYFVMISSPSGTGSVKLVKE
jgi:uncharacterized delta-60 repeat protein